MGDLLDSFICYEFSGISTSKYLFIIDCITGYHENPLKLKYMHQKVFI